MPHRRFYQPLRPAATGDAYLSSLYFTAGFPSPNRVRRIPGVNIVHYFICASGFFLDIFFNLLAMIALLLASAYVKDFIDRYMLSVLLRIIAFVAEALTHLVARMDTSFDRPGRTAAVLLATSFRRLLPTPRWHQNSQNAHDALPPNP